MLNKRARESLQLCFAPRLFSGSRVRVCVRAIARIAAAVYALVAVMAALGPVPGAIAGSQSTRSESGQPQQTYEGVVTDTRCGAKHSAAIGKTAADCSRACVHGGAEFALVDGDRVYPLDGELMVLKRLAGLRVKVVGTLNGDRLTVASVAAI